MSKNLIVWEGHIIVTVMVIVMHSHVRVAPSLVGLSGRAAATASSSCPALDNATLYVC